MAAAGAGDTKINSTNSITTVSINSYLIVTNYNKHFAGLLLAVEKVPNNLGRTHAS